MTRPVFADRFPNLEGIGVLVVGLGKSGLAAAKLAVAHGAVVTVTDHRTEDEIGSPAREARELGVRLRAGGQQPDVLDGIDLLIVSPGVPPTIPLMRKAAETGLPVWGEVELAARFCRGQVIGISGSNGKSTVTVMVGAILREAGFPGGTGGNLATPFSDLLVKDSAESIHSIELSSFQLETASTLHCKVAVLTNLSPDHLDRYESFDDYGRVKAQMLRLQLPDAACVLNADDKASRLFGSYVRAKPYYFSTEGPVENGAWLAGNRLTLSLDGREEPFLDREEIPVPGEHNVANALAAALAAKLVGCPTEAIIRGLTRFRGLPHRLEHVRTLNDVAFYNDSKATNPASTAMALSAFEPGTVHLILGGRDKGNDWSELMPPVGLRARQVLTIGECAPAIEEAFGDIVPTVSCGTVAAAVARGLADARPGDVVLLAPACASFDQYPNFEARGDDFRKVVGDA